VDVSKLVLAPGQSRILPLLQMEQLRADRDNPAEHTVQVSEREIHTLRVPVS
jgi:hypothetical protein